MKSPIYSVGRRAFYRLPSLPKWKSCTCRFGSIQTNRRVVITGIGLLTCLGVGKKVVWNRLVEGECGLSSATFPGYEKIPCKVAGFIPLGNAEGSLDLAKHVTPSEQRKMSQGSAYALIAAEEALNDAKWLPSSDKQQQRTGVAIGMGLVGMLDVWNSGKDLEKKGPNKISPYLLPRILVNMAAGNVSIKFGLKGPNHSVSTACTTGLHAIGDAFRFIQRGEADVMVAGGTEESPNPLSMTGFSRLKALSTNFNETPEKASRPFDKDRDGFVMSEGAGVVVLEELEHALQRGARIYSEVLGYGLSGDAHHITAPREDGLGAYNCMSNALNDSGVSVDQVGYINAHATSTPLGDMAESRAIEKLFNSHPVMVSSTKGATGHLLGAAGSVEAIFTALTCFHGIVPPTRNLENPSILPLEYIIGEAKTWTCQTRPRIAMTNSFGFGGTNGSLCISQFIQ